MALRMRSHLAAGLGLAASILIVSCGTQQMTFVPNCLPSIQAGDQAVAKVRYSFKVTNTTSGEAVETAFSDVQNLGTPLALDLGPLKKIVLPVKVELLNATGMVLATREVNDPELANDNRHGLKSMPGSAEKDVPPAQTFDFISAAGNRFIDTVSYSQVAFSYNPKLEKRLAYLVDPSKEAIACAVIVPTPTPSGTPPATPSALPTPMATALPTPMASPTPAPTPTPAPSVYTDRLQTTVTTSVPLQNQVAMSSTFTGGPDALYARLRSAAGGLLPERTGLGYHQIDQVFTTAGGSVETHFQPGSIADGLTGDSVAVGEPVTPLVNALANKVDVTLPWPNAEQFSRFKASDGTQRPVTGFLVRTFTYLGRTVGRLLGSQVTWGTEPKEMIMSRQASGGGGGGGGPALPYDVSQLTNDTTANVSAAANPGQTFTTVAAGDLASISVFLTSSTSQLIGATPSSCTGIGIWPICDVGSGSMPIAGNPGTLTPMTCPVTLKIYPVAAGVPDTGNLLGQQTATATVAGGMVTFTFGAPIAVGANTPYAFTLTTAGVDTATVAIKAADVLAGGTFLTDPTTVNAGNEMRFQAHVQ